MRLRQTHLQLGARHPLDEGVRGPVALFELQAAPLHLERIALGIELFQMHEHVARVVARVDHLHGRTQHGQPEDGKNDGHQLAYLHAASPSLKRSATRKRALRARGLRADSSASAWTSFPTNLSFGAACAGTNGSPA